MYHTTSANVMLIVNMYMRIGVLINQLSQAPADFFIGDDISRGNFLVTCITVFQHTYTHTYIYTFVMEWYSMTLMVK
jgi:hypothetical protein